MGALVLGLSPHRLLDQDYRNFLDLILQQINAATTQASSKQIERERLERMADLDRAKTEFFSNISHEFRTPLTLLLAPLEELLHRRKELPAALEKELEVAVRNSRQLLTLVNTLLDVSQIEAGRMRAHFEPSDLSALTRDIVSVFRSAAERAGLELEVKCPELPDPVWVDRGMWEKIVSNLLSNALKFTFTGQIEVELRALPQHAELTVRDTGVGIPKSELPNLFKRFHRVRGTRARSQDGSGIGLALVNDLVRLHQGRVRARSTEGLGSEFIVWIPTLSRPTDLQMPAEIKDSNGTPAIATALAEEAVQWLDGDKRTVSPEQVVDDLLDLKGPHEKGIEGPRGRIVIADDNADLRDYLRRLLGSHWEVDTVPDGQAALELVQRDRPDVVLADVMMPGLDGFALLKRIRENADLQQTAVILVTARAGEEAAIEGLLAGADDYIAKPFSPRELVARVHAVVDRAHADAALRDRAAWLAGQREALEAAVDGAPLATSLGALVRTAVAALGGNTRAAVYLTNEEGTLLRHVVGMSSEYAECVDGFRLGPESLACGLAAHRRESVLTADIMAEPRWEPWRWLGERFGYRACWSFPIHTSAGKPLGTLAMYSPQPREATERDQQLASLLTGTASIIISRHEESEARREAEAALATELGAMTRLRELSDRLLSTTDLKTALGEILDTAIALHEADRGTIQVYDPVADVLRYAAARGFDEAMLASIPPIDRDFHSTCAAAIRTGEQVIVTDMMADSRFTAHVPTAAALDYRAAFSFPLNTRRGEFRGVVTVHFRAPRNPADRELRWAALYAPLAAHLIERSRTEEALRASEEKYRTLFARSTNAVTERRP